VPGTLQVTKSLLFHVFHESIHVPQGRIPLWSPSFHLIFMDWRLETLIALLLACAVALSVAAHLFAVFPFDMKVTHELQEVKNPAFATGMRGVSALGGPVFELVLIGTGALICALRRLWTEAVFVAATASSLVLTAVLKLLVGRPRPPSYFLNPADLFLAVDQYSFPSGHVLFFVVFFGFVACLAFLHLTGWTRWAVMAGCTALIVLIAPSRIYLSAHWASDVIGSYVIGTLWLIILIMGYQMVVRRKRTNGQANA
jgi:membrane-associated phospholipid phosphatase